MGALTAQDFAFLVEMRSPDRYLSSPTGDLNHAV